MLDPSLSISHRTVVRATPQAMFDLVADTEGAPRFAPAQLFAEVCPGPAVPVRPGVVEDAVRRWVHTGETVRSWEVSRVLDRDRLRIGFTHSAPGPGIRAQCGAWSFDAVADGTTEVRVVHTLDADNAKAARASLANLEQNVPKQLSAYKFVGELGPGLPQLYITHRDSLVLAGAVDDVSAVLARPDVWALHGGLAATAAERAVGPGADLLTVAPPTNARNPGAPFRYIRICPAQHRFAYKRLDLARRLHAEVGEWRMVAHEGATMLSVERTVTLALDTLKALGSDDAALESAREQARHRLRGEVRDLLNGVAGVVKQG
ncbi:hypothetical protein ACIGW8_31160 [Streptomyces sioyaensis]|uniref:hypothetical protein n=1 Tax=Streptomyces sioyaensis TaxID=67364 RepID=UPI0037CE4EA4